MNEWKEYKLEDLIKTNNNTIGKEYPFSIIKYLDTGSITCNNIVSLQEFELKDAPSRAKRLVVEDDIIYSTVRPNQLHYGFIKNPVKNLVVSTGFVTITCNKNKINPLFLFYNLTQNQNTEFLHSIAEASTSTYPSLKPSDIESLDITLPPLSEQKAIANVLSSLDDKIELLHRQNATLEKMAETLFRQWFVEEAKEDWEEKKLGNMLTITSSKRIFYSEYVTAGVPFYRSKEIIELRNNGSTNSELYISQERYEEINNKYGSPLEGDILMTSVGTLGIAYRVCKNEKFYFKDGNLTWFKDFKEMPNSIIYLWLISKIGQEELASITIGSTQEALTIEGLKSITFKIPPKERIDECNIVFNSIIKKMEFNRTQINKLTQLRDTLLPKLMSGEVRVEIGGEE